MATRKLINVGCITFLLDSALLYTLPHYSTDLFNKCLLNSCFVPALRHNPEDIAVTETDQNPALKEFPF